MRARNSLRLDWNTFAFSIRLFSLYSPFIRQIMCQYHHLELQAAYLPHISIFEHSVYIFEQRQPFVCSLRIIYWNQIEMEARWIY
jgi:hypothetical protein